MLLPRSTRSREPGLRLIKGKTGRTGILKAGILMKEEMSVLRELSNIKRKLFNNKWWQRLKLTTQVYN